MIQRWKHLGRGLAFPVVPDGVSRTLPLEEGYEKVRQAIRLILSTEPGERVMRPGWGCGLRQFLMKPNTVATRALIQREISQALTAWEPRISLEEVRVEAGDDPALVLVDISYVHVRDSSRANLVFPFYLE